MSHTVMEKPIPRVPILKKIRGDESIQCNIPIAEAQFLIGKSWDVSLKLNFSEVQEKHCTIERISADAWTLSSHENTSVQINEFVLGSGCTKLLKCGDFIRLSSSIMFQFKCSSVTCDHCNVLSIIKSEEHENQPRTTELPGRRRKFDLDHVQNHDSSLLEYLQNIKDSAVNFHKAQNDVNMTSSSLFDEYVSPGDFFESVSTPDNDIEQYKNLQVKVLFDIITYQRDFIDKLQKQLNEFFHDFKSVNNRSNYLEGKNQHLKNENITLRAKIARYVKNAETLRNENLNLQAEIGTLNVKHEKLLSVIDSKRKSTENEICCKGADIHSNDVSLSCEAVMEVKTRLTKLLETEFKCTICDEVFIQAMVTNCGHTFCELCLSTWKVIKPNCPICRSTLIKENKALAVNSYLNSIMPFASSELQTNWLRVVNERKSANENSRRNQALKRKYANSALDTFFDETRYRIDLLLVGLNSTRPVS